MFNFSSLHTKNSYVLILAYHGIIRYPIPFFDSCFLNENMFRRQLKYMKKHFDIVCFTRAIELLRNNCVRRPTIVLTFDDGYQNNYDIAFPILQEERVPATIFLATGYIDTSETIWTGYLHHAFAMTLKTSLSWEGCRYNLTKPDQKFKAVNTIKYLFKQMPYSQIIPNVHKVISELDVRLDQSFENGSPYRILNSDAIREMNISGLVEFGAHTHLHPILKHLSHYQKEEEITKSINIVKKLIRKPCEIFSIPNGSIHDYDKETINILRKNGVTVCVTTIAGVNNGKTPIMELRRHIIGGKISMFKFKLIVHNIHSFLKNFNIIS